MGLQRSTLEAGVDAAFSAAGYLVQSGTFSKKNVTTFDWTAQDVTATTETVVAPVLLYQKQQYDSSVQTIGLVKQREWPGGLYDTLTLNGKTYTIVSTVDYQVVVELQLRNQS